MNPTTSDQTIFLTWVYSARQKWGARLLVDSIRSFGGALSDCPVWLFEANPKRVPCDDFKDMGVRVLPLNPPDTVRRYILAHKVYACAQAEALAPPGVQSLVWLAPVCFMARPPMLFDLGPSCGAAVRPVHIQNVGLLATAPLDDFWQGVYEAVGVRDVQTTVESFVDVQHIRAYFNSAALVVNPSLGLFRRWFELFEALVCDQAFQARACQDERHQIFLHQAVLSALIATMLEPEQVRTLPPDYGYPYNLHGDVPPDRRAEAFNDLTCVIYEERSVDPNKVDDIEIHEPLKSWLSAHADVYPG